MIWVGLCKKLSFLQNSRSATCEKSKKWRLCVLSETNQLNGAFLVFGWRICLVTRPTIRGNSYHWVIIPANFPTQIRRNKSWLCHATYTLRIFKEFNQKILNIAAKYWFFSNNKNMDKTCIWIVLEYFINVDFKIREFYVFADQI